MKLEVKDLYKSFGGTEVLHGISFSVESGRALGLLGLERSWKDHDDPDSDAGIRLQIRER